MQRTTGNPFPTKTYLLELHVDIVYAQHSRYFLDYRSIELDNGLHPIPRRSARDTFHQEVTYSRGHSDCTQNALEALAVNVTLSIALPCALVPAFEEGGHEIVVVLARCLPTSADAIPVITSTEAFVAWYSGGVVPGQICTSDERPGCAADDEFRLAEEDCYLPLVVLCAATPAKEGKSVLVRKHLQQ